MNHITNFAESFMKLFQLGGETFISWMQILYRLS